MIRSLLPASFAVLLAAHAFAAPPKSAKPSATPVPRTAQPIPLRSITGNLTLDRAVDIALRQNPQMLTQLQTIEQTRGQVISVRSQALPHLAINGNFDARDRSLIAGNSADFSGLNKIFDALGIEGGNGSSPQPQTKSYQISLDLNQVIYAGGQIRASIAIAKFAEDSAYFQLRDLIDSTIATTRAQFYTVLLTHALIAVQEESIQVLTDQLKDQQNRFEAGTVPRFNVLQAEVALANAQPDLIRARNDYLIAQLELAKILGLDPGPGGAVTFTAVGSLGIPPRPLTLSAALALARERRPFLKVQRLTILSQKEQIKVALAGYKPRLSAGASYLLRSVQASDRLDETVNGWFLGVTGSWSIFDGFETYGNVKQARAQLETARINYEDSVQQVELEVQRSYANLETARATIASQLKNIEQAREALRLASERLAAGAGTQLDVLNARLQLTQAQTTEIRSRADYNSFLAEFDRATAISTSYQEYLKDPLAGSTKLASQAEKAVSDGAPKAPPAKVTPAPSKKKR